MKTKLAVRYINAQLEDRWTSLPIKLKPGMCRKMQVQRAMHQIFGLKAQVVEIAVART